MALKFVYLKIKQKLPKHFSSVNIFMIKTIFKRKLCTIVLNIMKQKYLFIFYSIVIKRRFRFYHFHLEFNIKFEEITY